MPRLPPHQYLHRHHELRSLWLNTKMTFASVDASAQWHLHDYFQPSLDVRDQDLLGYKAVITLIHPSLPHLAGRAFADLQQHREKQAAAQALSHHAPHSKSGERRLKVVGVVHPTIKTGRLARGLIRMAEQQARKQQEREQEQGRDKDAA